MKVICVFVDRSSGSAYLCLNLLKAIKDSKTYIVFVYVSLSLSVYHLHFFFNILVLYYLRVSSPSAAIEGDECTIYFPQNVGAGNLQVLIIEWAER